MKLPIRIVALTETGKKLASQLSHLIPNSELWFKPQPFTQMVQKTFQEGHALILICATGIAVRTLAPVIKNKHEDPPVLVLDENGEFVIPLLSGHEGGANQWASEVSTLINAHCVITTAKTYIEEKSTLNQSTLGYTIGMGCERGCPQSELQILLEECIEKTGLSLDQVHSINSIDIKHDEVGLIDCAKNLQKPFQTFDNKTLSTVEHLLSTKSEYVFKTVGVYGVAESAALVAAQKAGGSVSTITLAMNKVKTKKATCAIAQFVNGGV